MQKNFKLVVDNFCEVFDLLEPIADDSFWDFNQHNFVPGAVYVVGRGEFGKHRHRFKEIASTGQAHVIFSNPAEGSETLIGQCHIMGITDLALNGTIPLLGGGAMDDRWTYLEYASFMPKILDYEENITAASASKKIYTQLEKPYKFLFLNGRMRPHRKFLLEKFQLSGLLDSAIWTNLDSSAGPGRRIKLMHNGENLIPKPMPIHYLDPKYEVERYRQYINQPKEKNFVKYELFQDTWGEIYISPEPYIDSYFSLVTETVFDYPYSFRTEKIWKPIVMGHPFVVAANSGFYRDLHNNGYRTFGHLIDERFDLIENSQQRIERIEQVVNDLCRQNLVEFLKSAQEICEHNQLRYAEHRIQERKAFPEKFLNFVNRVFFNQ